MKRNKNSFSLCIYTNYVKNKIYFNAIYAKIYSVYKIMLITKKYYTEENITFPYAVYITPGKNDCMHLSLWFREVGNLHISELQNTQ